MKRILSCVMLLLFLTACDTTTVRPTIGPAVTAPLETTAATHAATTASETVPPTTAAPTTVPPTTAVSTTVPAPTTVPPTTVTAQPSTTVSTSADTVPAEPQGQLYVLNTSTKKFHLHDCGSVKTMKPENTEYFTGHRQELIELGYKPCGNCDP